MRTILWIIKFSVIVYLGVENCFSWWNSLFWNSLFFNLKHQIDWYIKHTNYFLRVPCGIDSGLLCYHKKQKQQLLKTAFVTNSTKFELGFWVFHNKWKLKIQSLGYFIKSNYFPRVKYLAKIHVSMHKLEEVKFVGKPLGP